MIEAHKSCGNSETICPSSPSCSDDISFFASPRLAHPMIQFVLEVGHGYVIQYNDAHLVEPYH